MTTSVTEIPGYVAGTWDIDPVHSHIGFVGRHMVVSKVTEQSWASATGCRRSGARSGTTGAPSRVSQACH